MKYKDDLMLERLYTNIYLEENSSKNKSESQTPPLPTPPKRPAIDSDGNINLDRFKGDTREITSCEGNLICYYSKEKLDLSNLKYVRGKIDFKEANIGEIDLSSLENVGTGGISIDNVENLSLPSLKKCHGIIGSKNAKTLNIPSLEYTNWITANKVRDFDAPVLKYCTGLYLQDADILKAPALVTCEGNILAINVISGELPKLVRVRDINLNSMQTIELNSLEFVDRFFFKKATSVSMENLVLFHHGDIENAETINMPKLGKISGTFICPKVKELKLPELVSFTGDIKSPSAEIIDVRKLNRGSLAGRIRADSADLILIPKEIEGEEWLISMVFPDKKSGSYIGTPKPFLTSSDPEERSFARTMAGLL